MLTAGDNVYEMAQFHFHAPSEHLVGGKGFAMEAHFVHKKAKGAGLGVLGVFIAEGVASPAFARIADAFPKDVGNETAGPDVDPRALLPRSLNYWKYEGSLTTPPCTEVVDWMVCQQPVSAAKEDIAKFTAMYAMNARPAQQIDRRFILQSS
jgi:carbonic anhydrase